MKKKTMILFRGQPVFLGDSDKNVRCPSREKRQRPDCRVFGAEPCQQRTVTVVINIFHNALTDGFDSYPVDFST